MTTIGRVSGLVRYPVKSMAGIPVASAHLGFHGFAGDRRFAFRRIGDGSGFPFLTAGRFPALLTYQPIEDSDANEPRPTRVRTPSGAEADLHGEELRREITERSGHEVELMMLRHGIFDDGAVSVIGVSTIAAIGREAGMALDPRRMRANILLDTDGAEPFGEDEWVGGTLVFGDRDESPVIAITARDERCAMINLDPDTGQQDARVMKVAVRMNGNYAGVYGTAVRTGVIHVGQIVRLAKSPAA